MPAFGSRGLNRDASFARHAEFSVMLCGKSCFNMLMALLQVSGNVLFSALPLQYVGDWVHEVSLATIL